MMRTQLALPRLDPVQIMSGGAVEIRPGRRDDEERIRRFIGGLSARTRAQRFFTGTDRPSASLVRALLAVDERHDAPLAVPVATAHVALAVPVGGAVAFPVGVKPL